MFLIIIININTTKIKGYSGLSRISETILTSTAIFKDTKSAVSLSSVYASLMKLLPACKLSADICREC